MGCWQGEGTDHELHGEEAVTASPQAGLCQQAVDPVGDAPVKLQLPLHHLALSIVQEKGTLGDGMGEGDMASHELLLLGFLLTVRMLLGKAMCQTIP